MDTDDDDDDDQVAEGRLPCNDSAASTFVSFLLLRLVVVCSLAMLFQHRSYPLLLVESY